ncbi:MAG: SUMF1/EgtB/PvdO family nonheme iron enzyme [Bacteroidia bacterium]
MRNIFLFISGILLASCASKKDAYDVVRKAPKQKLVPPGTVWLRDNLFIDQAEIDNFSYLEFLNWIKRRDTKKYAAMYPDTLCWSRADVGSANELAGLYLKHRDYSNYPATGISYGQAIEFCQWRTDRVNEFLLIKEGKFKYHPDSNYADRAPKRVKYRLPSKEEWEYAAAAGLKFCDFPMGYESLIDKYGIPVSNTLEYYSLYKKDFANCTDTLFIIDPTSPVFAGRPNKYGLFQILGNVSEIIADSLCKGLNFTTPVYSMKREESESGSYTISTEIYNYKLDTRYKRPEPWLGFRCICEVLK